MLFYLCTRIYSTIYIKCVFVCAVHACMSLCVCIKWRIGTWMADMWFNSTGLLRWERMKKGISLFAVTLQVRRQQHILPDNILYCSHPDTVSLQFSIGSTGCITFSSSVATLCFCISFERKKCTLYGAIARSKETQNEWEKNIMIIWMKTFSLI